MPLLTVHNVTKKFGGLTAVSEVSFEVGSKRVIGVIGANGSGKSTLLRLIMGVLKPDRGEIYFKSRRIDGLKPHAVARIGIGLVHQLPKIFSSMTVYQNMLVSSQDGIGLETGRKGLKLLEFFKLNHLKNERAGSLSYGEQKLLELARVLMLDTELVLLDEPAAGLHPVLIESVLEYIKALNQQGTTFVVVEHQMQVISGLCDRIVVLDHGEKIAEGAPKEIQSDQRVIDAYLGEQTI